MVLILRNNDYREILRYVGESCSEEDESVGFFDHKYVDHCPCVSGLSCEPTEIKACLSSKGKYGFFIVIGTVRIDERCVEGEQTTPTEPKPETQTEPEPVTQTEPEPKTETEPEPKTETEPNLRLRLNRNLRLRLNRT
ncbi:hypothetical protein CEXT_164421 [Caerostris extrusa]|uniref:Uncharacterized protein n=1 Tax=Caerostris extrusa TaxID=172846 RepID=A0AAV4PVN9_CAEEX|nr:hypothetical protein CEXT_164421 [Caerostris extrusa]